MIDCLFGTGGMAATAPSAAHTPALSSLGSEAQRDLVAGNAPRARHCGLCGRMLQRTQSTHPTGAGEVLFSDPHREQQLGCRALRALVGLAFASGQRSPCRFWRKGGWGWQP
jgi:hypothetical protein